MSDASPIAWLAALPPDELLGWLRSAVVREDPAPLVVPHATSFAVFLAGALRRAGEPLDSRVRAALPILLREWGWFRPRAEAVLETLLIVAAEIRCATAEAEIVAIARERLAAVSDPAVAVRLRQRCLSVLAGIGPTERSVPLFEQLVEEVDYAALCYRALYRADWLRAASELPVLLRTFSPSESARLTPVLRLMFASLGNRHRLELLERLFKSLDVVALERTLDLLPLSIDAPPPGTAGIEVLTLRVRDVRGGIDTDEVVGQLRVDELPLACVRLLAERAERDVPAAFDGWLMGPT